MTNRESNDGAELGSQEATDNGSAKQADGIRGQLNLVTQKTRFTLLQNIMAHPEGKPSLKELVYANPSKSKSTIRNHLEKLIDGGIVETVELPEDERSRDLPYRFYQFTEEGLAFLEHHDLLRAEETLKEMHSMLEKTPEIEKYIEAPRPDDAEDDGQESDESRRTVKP